MNYNTLIHTIVDPFISNPDALLIREMPSENPKNVSLLICSSNEDIAKLIGKKGCIANAIRSIVSIAGKLEDKRVFIKFEPFGENSNND